MPISGMLTMDAPVIPTPYRISTITCNGFVGTQVDIIQFFNNVNISPTAQPGFVYSEYKGKQFRGAKPKTKRGSKVKKTDEDKKCFDNQVTVVYCFADGYFPNVKLFRNGNVQMTGIRTPEDGQRIIEIVASELRRIHEEGVTNIVSDIDKLHACDFKIRMINSNFSVPYSVRRKDLHKLLISPDYNNNCNFQGTTYPGVKLYFYWNSTKKHQNGICQCSNPCYGKGTGHGDGECKKVTVAVFESGNVLITGANTNQQIDDAYQYITKVLINHVSTLKKTLPPPCPK
jgi:TATA-box binding protein (TBP) (component of TFIID and TFIIIB)